MSNDDFISKALRGLAKIQHMPSKDLVKVIRKYKRTKNEEEKEKLKEIVINNNVKFVIQIAAKFAKWHNVSKEDMFQNGMMGILVALEKFKPNKGFLFSTYAKAWIEQSIRNTIGAERVISVKRNNQKKNISIYFKCLNESDGDHQRFMDLIKKRGISKKTFPTLRSVINIMYSPSVFANLDQPLVGDDGNESFFHDVIEDVNSPNPEELTTENCTRQDLLYIINNHLSPQEKSVIMERYMGASTPSLTSVANNMYLTIERVRQVETKAIGKIKRAYTKMQKNIPNPVDPEVAKYTKQSYSSALRRISSRNKSPINYNKYKLFDETIPVNECETNVFECSIGLGSGKSVMVKSTSAMAAVVYCRINLSSYEQPITILSVDGKPPMGKIKTYTTWDMPDFRNIANSRKRFIEELILCSMEESCLES